MSTSPQPVFDPDAFMASRQPKPPASLTSFDPDSFMAKRAADSTFAGNAFPELKTDSMSRTLFNMTAAMSGQKLATPEDEAIGRKGKEAGFESAGVTALTSLGGELLAAPKLLEVAARDPATGQFVRGLATKEGPTLLRQAVTATQAAGEAHPLLKQALIQGLTMLGAGGVAKALGWLGKAAAAE